MTIQSFINRTRVILGDQEDQNFTDEEIIGELNAAILELCDQVGFYVKSESLPLIDGQLTYDLPEDCMKLERLRWDGNRGQELNLINERDLTDELSLTQSVVAIRDESSNSFSLNQPATADNTGESLQSYRIWSH